jgi:2-polyprenyl-6-methoxyphenol hydroxylase-like FAD-dependent oxidoreductase
VVQARTLEVLQTIGLAEPFLERGTIAAGAQIYVDGRAAGGFSFENVGHPDTPYPLVLVLPQSDVEAILIEHLGARGIDVERGVTATGLDQDAAGVTLRVTDGPGAEHALRSRYLIGADGAHSIVRKRSASPSRAQPMRRPFCWRIAASKGTLPTAHSRSSSTASILRSGSP